VSYTTARRDGAWHVIDAETDQIVQTAGAGPAGAEAAATALARWNARASGPAADLRAWRKAQGLTQGALAAKLGVFWITVQRWESGARAVPPFLHLALKYLEEHPS